MTDAGATAARGRPRAVSRSMLQEAAFECFIEHGYARTTVEHIATRAGVSRSTFFGYFSGKADVFWIDLDDAVAAALATLDAAEPDRPAMALVRDAMLAAAAELGPDRVPWPLTQAELIDADEALRASAARIVAALVAALADAVARRIAPASIALAEPAAAAVVGAAVAALASWARSGTVRGALAPRIDAAISPVCAGFAHAIDAAR